MSVGRPSNGRQQWPTPSPKLGFSRSSWQRYSGQRIEIASAFGVLLRDRCIEKTTYDGMTQLQTDNLNQPHETEREDTVCASPSWCIGCFVG